MPQTEVGRLSAAGRDLSFAAPGADDTTLGVYPLSPPVDVAVPTLVRPEPLPGPAFAEPKHDLLWYPCSGSTNFYYFIPAYTDFML